MNAFKGRLGEVPADSLSYIGDAVYELALRRHVLGAGRLKAGSLHRLGVRFANAAYQAKLARRLQAEGRLSAEEEAVLLRGRNAQPGAMAKHADPVDYRWASGLEALLGYLYLKDEQARLEELLAFLLADEPD